MQKLLRSVKYYFFYNMILLKFGFVLTVLLMTITISLPWFSNSKVEAIQNVEHDLSRLERSLVPRLNGFFTCGRTCVTSKECEDCWICCTCRFGYCDTVAP
ncbi:hypothetical protein A4A49_53732 [Nicotiana attenuata]|uniref:Carboxypeptidase A inhibitor-like domain-containing protein n=1 Tax=Nicotiana attenuata TaxID=49451 RepID=A0A1J6KCH6_NICAT|nr:hypothetical protein A4A49_53732 [Nicotiana attenuata]